MANGRMIDIGKGLHAIVDDADYDELVGFNWRPHVTKGGKTYVYRGAGKPRWEYMHRRLLPGHRYIDHRNGNGLDNRRRNLRPATNSENMRNRTGPQRNNRSGFLGVAWHKKSQLWRAVIVVPNPPGVPGRGKPKHLGFFKDPAEAARVRDDAARELHGEFAYFNFSRRRGGDQVAS